MSEIIKVKNISKSFKKINIFDNINLNINKNEIIGIIGSNGSGKSVLFKLICGLEKPDHGEISVRNKLIGKDIDFPESLGVVINTPGYIDIYSGFDNLKFLAGIRNIITDNKIKDTLTLVGLDYNAKTSVKNYSLGMKQKLGIAQAIMEDQEIIILDEPFNALDFKTKRDIKEILKVLKSNGKTILLTSHNHEDIEELCDVIYIIIDKKIIPLSETIKNEYFV